MRIVSAIILLTACAAVADTPIKELKLQGPMNAGGQLITNYPGGTLVAATNTPAANTVLFHDGTGAGWQVPSNLVATATNVQFGEIFGSPLDNADLSNALANAGTAAAAGSWRNTNWFLLSWDSNPTSAPDSIVWSTNLDEVIQRHGFDRTKQDRVAQISEQHQFAPLDFSVSPTNYALVSSNGYLTHLADGTVTAVVNFCGFARTNVLVLTTGGVAVDRVWGAAPGTLRYAVVSNVNAHVTGAVMQVFSTYNTGTLTFVRNTNLWIRPAPVFAPAHNRTFGMHRGGALITARHAVVATHYPPTAGNVMYWVDETNAVFSATVTAVRAVSGDLALIRLGSDVPVRVAKLLADPAAVLPNGINELPLALGDVHFGSPEFQMVIGGPYTLGAWWVAPASQAWRAMFRHFPVGGDSGQPCLFSTGTDYVLLFCLLSPTEGISVHACTAQIQAAIAAWGDTNLLSYLSVTNYTEF